LQFPLAARAAGEGMKATPMTSVDFIHEQEPPTEWTRRLRELSPKRDNFGWLELVWEPGDPWAPVQRWTLYEMLHTSLLAPPDYEEEALFGMPVELFELKGEHPRTEGHICTDTPTHEWTGRVPREYRPCLCRHKMEAWKGGPHSMATLTTWRLFRRTGYVGRQFWVIQGKHGGHRRWLRHEESLLLEAEGYPTELPDPGMLAYAPFDERVVKKIERFNRLWQLKNNLDDFKERVGPGWEQHRREVQKELRRQMVNHLKSEMADVTEAFVDAADAGEMDELPKTEIDYDRLEPQSEESFIETGKILHHTRMQ
jgi:hypothetical protein